MKNLVLALAGSVALLSACASDLGERPESPLKADLGQVVETGMVQPVNGITAAGQPDERALEVFASSGYRAVIDLRTAGESRGLDERAVVEGLGMDYVSLPIGRDEITFENAKALDDLIGRYDAPVLLHCSSSNRVGALLALRASLDGADDEAALEIGREGGLSSLEGRVVQTLRDD